MTVTGQEPANEWHRLARVSSVVDVVARHVDDLVRISADGLPGWLAELAVPAGWRIARIEGSAAQPLRIAVCGQQPRGGWEGCDTISAFGFTGNPPHEVVREHSDCTLRDLDAEGLTTHTLGAPAVPGVTAVRSSGSFSTAGLRVWAQYSTYVAGSDLPGQGCLIQHSVFVESGCRARLSDDIAHLSHAVHQAFLTAIVTR